MNVVYNPPETIRQECWNIGLILAIPLVPLNLLVVGLRSVEQAIPLIVISLLSLTFALVGYWLRHKEAY